MKEGIPIENHVSRWESPIKKISPTCDENFQKVFGLVFSQCYIGTFKLERRYLTH